jgi:hypothetical protein
MRAAFERQWSMVYESYVGTGVGVGNVPVDLRHLRPFGFDTGHGTQRRRWRRRIT